MLENTQSGQSFSEDKDPAMVDGYMYYWKIVNVATFLKSVDNCKQSFAIIK
jgi:hypothetical protein